MNPRLASFPRATRRRRALVPWILVATLGAALSAFAARSPASERPNVVVILADDLGWGDLRAYNPGSKIPTPNLDRLAAEGMRFTDAHSPSAVCSPTRYALLTGRYAWRSRLQSGVLWGYSPPLVEPGRLTLAGFLKDQGYATGFVGKWHLGLRFATRGPAEFGDRIQPAADPAWIDWNRPLVAGPHTVGFDEAFGIPASLDMVPYFYFDRDRVVEAPTGWTAGSRHQRQGGQGFWREGPIAPGFAIEGCEPALRDKASEFIRHQSRHRPFLLYLALTSPHDPWVPLPAWQGRSACGPRGDFIAQLDDTVGEIMTALDEGRHTRRTLLIFTSDNGAHWLPEEAQRTGHAANGPWRGMKSDAFEGGHRVPFLVRWPQRVRPGSECDAVIGLQDLFATLAEITGRPLPVDAAEDSVSFAPALDGRSQPPRPPLVHHSIRGVFALRDGPWKLIAAPDSGGWSAGKVETEGQLYRLDNDAGERTNLWTEEPARRDTLSAVLARLRQTEVPASPFTESSPDAGLDRPLPSTARDAVTTVAFQDPEPGTSSRTGPVRAARAPLADARPNIIVIMTDDQGYGEIGRHGNPILATPHLDRLHDEAARFVDFTVSPTCSPTRAALMTGAHEFRSGVTHTIFERERLSLNATTLPEVLRHAGYRTGIFGKWHLGDERPYQPDRRGFDEVFIHGAGGIGQTYAGSCGDVPDNGYFDPVILHNGRFVKTSGYCTDVFFEQAIQWIATRRHSRRPFFAYITPNAPHAPNISPGPAYDRLFDGHGLNTNQVAYYSMIRNIDDQVGRLLGRLSEWDLERNTLVIFLTDNGHSMPRMFNAGMRSAKGSPYQGGIRVPSFWRWPGRITPGDRIHMAAHLDVFPTLAEIAGVRLRPKSQRQIEGRSLVPCLEDPDAPWPERTFITHVGRWPSGRAEEWKYRGAAIRRGPFKLVHHTELYDLVSDPGETSDLAAQHPDLVSALRAEFDAWWTSVLPAALASDAAVGPSVNPMKALYWRQFGGGPDAALLRAMDPAGKFERR